MNAPGTSAPPVATPAPSPAPTPTPPLSPTPTARSAEYQASGPVVAANAGYAHDRGITGKGVIVAVIDSGIDLEAAEFAGRVSTDSTSFDQGIARCATCPGETIRFGLDDIDGHGTQVASVIAAARNETGVHGIAYDGTILALKATGPNLEGLTAGSTGPIPESRNPNAALLAPAIRHAVEKGAFVVNMSLNGFARGEIAAEQRAAMDLVRLGDRLLVQSVSNVTDEDSFTGKFTENLVGADRTNADWFLYAIGVRADGSLRGGNGNAGPLADRMLATTGVDVRVVDKDGSFVVVTGNSFAAPAVAGAAALLKQQWPQLGGRAISRILLDTATDAGAPGIDPLYGAGLLNVEKAMQAQAPASSFAAAQAAMASFASLTLSAPFGGSAAAKAVAGGLGSMTVFDRYGRDFAMAGDPGLRSRGSGLLAGGMLGTADLPGIQATITGRRFGFGSSAPVGPWQGGASGRPASFTYSPARGQTATFAANVAVGQASGLAGSPLRGVVSAPVGMSTSWSGSGWSAGFSSGASRGGRSSLEAVRFSTPLGFGLELSELRERGQALGMSAGAGVGLQAARTRLTTFTAVRHVVGLTVGARATLGRTRVGGGSDLMRFSGPLVSTAFALDASRSLFGGMMTLGASSPLRVERARASLLVPVAYDLISGALATERRSFDLSPSARELDLEMGWSAALSSTSSLRLGVARAFDAGNVRGASDAAAFVNLVIR